MADTSLAKKYRDDSNFNGWAEGILQTKQDSEHHSVETLAQEESKFKHLAYLRAMRGLVNVTLPNHAGVNPKQFGKPSFCNVCRKTWSNHLTAKGKPKELETWRVCEHCTFNQRSRIVQTACVQNALDSRFHANAKRCQLPKRKETPRADSSKAEVGARLQERRGHCGPL